MARDAKVTEVMTFFDMKASEFMAQWKALTPEDKDYYKQAIGQELNLV